MLPPLLKRLLIASDGAKSTTLGVGKTLAKAERCKCTFLSEDGLIKGGVVLVRETNTYSSFSLTAFGLAPATSPEGVFWPEGSGDVRIDFNINFAEGEAVDSLKGTFTLLEGWLNQDRGRWIASVSSSGREVARVKGTWSQEKL